MTVEIPISRFYINSHWLVLDSLHIFVLYQPTQFFIASQCLSVSVGAICWGKRVVRNSESEMAAKRRSPWGTSSVTTPRIPLCRPWTLTSESTLDNHLLPHTSQNKDCRGFSDAHSWHVVQELLWMNTSFKNVLYKQQVLKIRETWNRKSDSIWGEISMADLLLMFMLMNAYHESQLVVRYYSTSPRAVFGIEGQPVAQCKGECTDALIHLIIFFLCCTFWCKDLQHWNICHNTKTDRYTVRMIYEEADRQLLRKQTGRLTGRSTDKQTGKQTVRCTHINCTLKCIQPMQHLGLISFLRTPSGHETNRVICLPARWL